MTPVAVIDRDGEPWVEWVDMTGMVPDEPFFDTVRVDLVTHVPGGISTYGVILAEKMNALARR